MKVDVANIATQEAINDRVPDDGTKGLSFETIDAHKGVTQSAKIDNNHCLVISEIPTKQLQVQTIALP